MASRAHEIQALINKELDNDTVFMGDDERLVTTNIPTGILPVDDLLQGGLPRGRWTEFFGDYCVTPDTLVLTDALSWVPAGDLQEDYGLVGFDEEVNQGRGRAATMKPSRVEHLGNRKLDCVRIVTDKGEVTVSVGHGFVARHRTQGSREWRRAGDIQAGDSLLWTTEPWSRDTSWEAGYLAGIFDGEGWLDGARLQYGQLPGAVLDESLVALKRRGFDASVNLQSEDTGVMRVAITGGRWETLRALGQLGSVRWIDRAVDVWSGAGLVSKGPHTEPGSSVATVLAVEFVGPQDVVTMQTSSRTFIANGFPSHNSTLKSYIAYSAIARCQEMGGTAALVDTEHAWDAEWGESLGIDVDELIVQRPPSAELAIDVSDVLIRQEVDLLVWDSVAAMVPQAEASKREHGEHANVAELARLMSRGMRKLTTANTRTALVYINQTRMNIGVTFGSNETTPGGRAPSFYASHRVRCQKGGKVTEAGKMWVGGGQSNTYSTMAQKVKLELHKSKLTKPHREVWMLYDMQESRVVDEEYLFARAVQDGIITSPSKGWFKLKGGKKKWRREPLAEHIWEDDALYDELIEELFPWSV